MAIGIVMALGVWLVLVPIATKVIGGKPPIPGWAFGLLVFVMFMLGMVRG